jgi:hypothetical protein
MDKVEEYISREETLKAMASSWPSRDRSPERKRKESRKVDED